MNLRAYTQTTEFWSMFGIAVGLLLWAIFWFGFGINLFTAGVI